MFIKYLFAKLLLVIFLINPVVAAERKTGVYSNLSFNRESGDINGIEIFLIYSVDGFKVIFQDSEGVPSVPIIIPAKIQMNHLSFELPDRNGYSGKFVGVIYNNKLIGNFSNGAIGKNNSLKINLKKGKSYWQ